MHRQQSNGAKRLRLRLVLLLSFLCTQAEANEGDPGNGSRAWNRAEARLDAAAAAKDWNYIPALGEQARGGDTQAQYELSVAYATGKLATQDKRASIKWMHRAAELGNSNAQCSYGTIVEKLAKTTEELSEAVNWWRKAADQGSSCGQELLATAYKSGIGVAVNYDEAFRWYALAANQGSAYAQMNLALAYAAGSGVQKSDSLALEWTTKAAEAGNQMAQYYLGTVYANGLLGAKPDMAQATLWWQKAAAQGLKDAQARLGAAYFTGEGIPRDDIQALMWFVLAASRGSLPAKQMVDDLVKKMPKDQTQEAYLRASRFKATPIQ